VAREKDRGGDGGFRFKGGFRLGGWQREIIEDDGVRVERNEELSLI
jgi:hypothetical protein